LRIELFDCELDEVTIINVFGNGEHVGSTIGNFIQSPRVNATIPAMRPIGLVGTCWSFARTQ
jgi:hypothetical protein